MTEFLPEQESLQNIYQLNRDLGRLFISEADYCVKIKAFILKFVVSGKFPNKKKHHSNLSINGKNFA